MVRHFIKHSSFARRPAILLVIAMVVAAIVAARVSLAADSAQQTAAKAISTAASALIKEYQGYLKDPATKLREKPDYFAEGLGEGLNKDALLKALSQSFGGDRGAEAYVKWQFLSGLPAKFEGDMVAPATAAFNSAPEPSLRPGSAIGDKTQLMGAIRGLSQDDIPNANAEWLKQIEMYDGRVFPIVKYGDELFARLPASFEVLRTAFMTAWRRAEQGATSTLMHQAIGRTREWAATAPKDQVRQMAALINGMITRVAPPAKGGADITPVPSQLRIDRDNLAELYGALCGIVTTDNQPSFDNPTQGAVFAGGRPSTPRRGGGGGGGNNNQPKNGFPPYLYTGLQWDAKNKKAIWTEQQLKFVDVKELEDLFSTLKDIASGNPAPDKPAAPKPDAKPKTPKPAGGADAPNAKKKPADPAAGGGGAGGGGANTDPPKENN